MRSPRPRFFVKFIQISVHVFLLAINAVKNGNHNLIAKSSSLPILIMYMKMDFGYEFKWRSDISWGDFFFI